ncbi:MAG: hypothetical protein PHT40_03540 [Patescibacteria group bacterium]|nr:hypothetical protein [Patescibacteria group bacterium]
MASFQKKNLIVLTFSLGTSDFVRDKIEIMRVDDAKKKEKSLLVDAEHGGWGTGYYINSEIGKGSSSNLKNTVSFCVIGVYDRTNLKHLQSMISTIQLMIDESN